MPNDINGNHECTGDCYLGCQLSLLQPQIDQVVNLYQNSEQKVYAIDSMEIEPNSFVEQMLVIACKNAIAKDSANQMLNLQYMKYASSIVFEKK